MVWSVVLVEDKNIYFIQWRLTKTTPGKKIPPRKFRESSTCRAPSQVHCRWPPSIIISRSFTQPASHSLSLSLHYSRECRRLCDMRMHFQHLTIYPNQDAPVQVGVCVWVFFADTNTSVGATATATASASAVQVAAAPQSNHARTHATSTTTRQVQYREHIQKKRSFPP